MKREKLVFIPLFIYICIDYKGSPDHKFLRSFPTANIMVFVNLCYGIKREILLSLTNSTTFQSTNPFSPSAY